MDGHGGLGDIQGEALKQDTLECVGETVMQSTRGNQDDLEVGVGGLEEGGCLQGQGEKSQNGDHSCD